MIKKTLLIVMSLWLLLGCSATYKQVDMKQAERKLDPDRGVLISVPDDGAYEDRHYKNSGQMTANAVRDAFAKHAKTVDIAQGCKGEQCLENIDAAKYGYFVKPVILQWEDRATEWSGRPDVIKIQLVVYDAATRKELSNFTYSGESKWATFGGDHPQDLLPEPTGKYVSGLYK